MERHFRGLATAVTVAILIGGCAGDPEPMAGSRTQGDRALRPIHGEAAELLPFESLVDWISLGDHVVVFDVTDEEETVLPPDFEGSPEADVDRVVTVEKVDVLYSFPGSPPFPSEVDSVLTPGGGIDAGGQPYDVLWDGPFLEVGKRYVASFATLPFDEAGNGEWALQNSASVFLIVGDVLQGLAGDEGIRAELSGLTLEELEDLVVEVDVAEGVNISSYSEPLLRLQDAYDAANPTTTVP